MKLSKTTWIAVAVGVVVIGGISLLVVLNQQNSQKADLEKRLALAQQKIALADNDKLIAQRDQLKQNVDNYSAEIKSIRASLSFPDDNIGITEKVIISALDSEVELLDLRSPGPSTENLEGVKYSTMNVTIRARGTTQTLSNFIYNLKEDFPTSVVKSVSLSFAESGDTQTDVEIDPELPEPEPTAPPLYILPESSVRDIFVTINMVIYDYEGD